MKFLSCDITPKKDTPRTIKSYSVELSGEEKIVIRASSIQSVLDGCKEDGLDPVSIKLKAQDETYKKVQG